MLISPKRFHRRLGPTVVGMALETSPSIAAYKFDCVTGWGTRYADPATAASISGDGLAVGFGTGNNRILVGGVTGSSSGVRIYEWSQKDGYGARTLQSITDPNAISFTRSGGHILVSGTASCTEWNFTSGSGFGSQVFSQGAGPDINHSSYIFDDKFFVIGLRSSDSFRIYSRAATPVLLASRSYFGSPSAFSMSPITHSGTRVLAVSHTSNTARLYRITAAGAIDSEITSTIGSGIFRMVFDPYGRLIVGRTNELNVYTLDSAGTQTLVQTITNTGSMTFTGSGVRVLRYDEDMDVLFVGSTAAPYITAYRMGGAGFTYKYPDPATSVARTVRGLSLHYNEAWKYVNI